MHKLQFLNATNNSMTMFLNDKTKHFLFFNFLTWCEFQTYTGIPLSKSSLLVTSSTWSCDFVWKWLRVFKLHISHMTKVMIPSILSFWQGLFWGDLRKIPEDVHKPCICNELYIQRINVHKIFVNFVLENMLLHQVFH